MENKKYQTQDKTLTISSIGQEGEFNFSAANNRVSFNSTRSLITIIDTTPEELIYIEFKNNSAITLYLKDSQEALDIAAFLNVDIYDFAKNGNDYVLKNNNE